MTKKDSSPQIIFFIGRMGSGKSHFASQCCFELKKEGSTFSRIEVSEVVKSFSKSTDRKSLQNVKDNQSDPDWLVKALLAEIKSSVDKECIVISGLREYWILKKIRKIYPQVQVVLIDAPDNLRRQRLNLSNDEFKHLEDRDDKIGVRELIAKERNNALIISNKKTYEKKRTRREIDRYTSSRN